MKRPYRGSKIYVRKTKGEADEMTKALNNLKDE